VSDTGEQGCGISHLIHVNVMCSDFDRSLAFYCDVLGASVAGGVTEEETSPGLKDVMGFEGPARFRGAMLYWGDRDRSSYIDLVEYSEPGQRIERTGKDLGLARLALRVRDVEAARQWLVSKGVEIVGDVIDLALQGRGRKILFIRDPAGTLLELVERIGPSNRVD
jgi:catechol 2,3-dioxygenase-like lactoylglutathione lyase family enzyme